MRDERMKSCANASAVGSPGVGLPESKSLSRKKRKRTEWGCAKTHWKPAYASHQAINSSPT